MGKLKSYQEQVQQVLAKGIDKAEQSHKRLISRPFDFAEKVEKEAKSHSIKSVRQAHNQYAKTVYSSLRTLNERANSYASDLISRLEKEDRKAAQQAAAKDAPAKAAQKPAAKKTSSTRKASTAKKSDAGTQPQSTSNSTASA